MSGRDSFQPYPETRFASMDRKRAVFAQHTPRQNHLLAALLLEDYERLLPDLEPVPLPPGWTVHGAGEREKYLYSLAAGIVSRVYVMESGASAHLAVTGSEGVIGVASFLGGEGTPSQVMVLSGGCAYRLGPDVMKNEFQHGGGPLHHLLLHYTQALIAQTGQIAVRKPAPFSGTATVPLDLVMPGPVALERVGDDAGADRPRAGRAPRRRHGGRWKAPKGGTDPLQPRPHCRTRSPPTGSASMRVLCGRQTGI